MRFDLLGRVRSEGAQVSVTRNDPYRVGTVALDVLRQTRQSVVMVSPAVTEGEAVLPPSQKHFEGVQLSVRGGLESGEFPHARTGPETGPQKRRQSVLDSRDRPKRLQQRLEREEGAESKRTSWSPSTRSSSNCTSKSTKCFWNIQTRFPLANFCATLSTTTRISCSTSFW